MGVPRLRWNEIPLAKEMPDTRAIDLAIGPAGAPILRSPSAVNMGNPHAIFWVDDVEGYDLRPDRPGGRTSSAVSTTRQHHARRRACARPYRDPHLGARRRPHQGVRFGGLRRRGRRRAACTHRPRGHRHPARRRPCDRVARSGRSCADDRAGRVTSTTAASMLRCWPMPARLEVGRSRERRGRHLRLPPQCLRVGSDPPRALRAGLERRGGGQHLRRHRRGRAPGAAGDPRAAPRTPAGEDRGYRLRGADRAADFRRHAGGRRVLGNAREAQRGGLDADRGRFRPRRRTEGDSSTTSWRSARPPRT